MKILVAPDSFKESLSAEAVCAAIARGIRKAAPRAAIVSVPMADGGEGTLQALVAATKGQIRQARVRAPLGNLVKAHWGILRGGRTAVVEIAQASGLPLVPPRKRNPLLTSSYGTGQIIRLALDRGCREILLTLGGVATNDAGAGFARALGYRLLDRSGREIPEGAQGLLSLSRIDDSLVHPRLKRVRFSAACDVRNPLCGPQGSAAVYGPQKGATPAMIPVIERALRQFARVVERDLGVRIIDRPGAGAAGGAGAGALAFLGAELKPGVDLVLKAVDLDRRMKGADLVVTGEGRIDRQTFFGKTIDGVSRLARRRRIPVIALCGEADRIAPQARARGIVRIEALLSEGRTRADCFRNTARLLEELAKNTVREWIDSAASRR
jgi:glycerate kinase